jgi:hypothetical protein
VVDGVVFFIFDLSCDLTEGDGLEDGALEGDGLEGDGLEDGGLEDGGLEGDGLEDGGELSDCDLGVFLASGLAGLESDELELFEELLSLFEFFTSEKPSLYFD